MFLFQMQKLKKETIVLGRYSCAINTLLQEQDWGKPITIKIYNL